MSNYLRVEARERGVLVRFRDPAEIGWNFDHIEGIGREFYGLVGHERIVLDFEGVDLCLAAAFEGKLLGLHKRAMDAGNTLYLCGLHPTTTAQFEVNKLSRIFHIVPDWWEVLG